jgi:Holliday junction DNA helicase RuvA
MDPFTLMIAHLRGTLLEKHPNQAVIEAGGVGYDVAIPVSTFSALPETGREVNLRIHTHVREDAIALFGFATAEEKLLFGRLTSVSGIGPKLAITVLSGLAAPDLIAAIRAGAAERLVRIPGVGKKTAERIILELREKMPEVSGAGAATQAGPPLSGVEQDVLSALMNLGSNAATAEAAVKKAKEAGVPVEFEPLFRRSLEFLR